MASLSRLVLEPPRSSDCTLVSASSSLPSFSTPPLALEDISQSSPPRLCPDEDPNLALVSLPPLLSPSEFTKPATPKLRFRCAFSKRRALCPSHNACALALQCARLLPATQCWWEPREKTSHRRQFHRPLVLGVGFNQRVKFVLGFALRQRLLLHLCLVEKAMAWGKARNLTRDHSFRNWIAGQNLRPRVCTQSEFGSEQVYPWCEKPMFWFFHSSARRSMLSLSILTVSLFTDRSRVVAVSHRRPATRMEAETHVHFDLVRSGHDRRKRGIRTSSEGTASRLWLIVFPQHPKFRCENSGQRKKTPATTQESASDGMHF